MGATAQIVDGKMEPIGKVEPTKPLIVTGQYLYDQFITSDGSGTRMAWIRSYLVPNADVMQVKGACDEMVKVAHARDIAAGVPEKERGPKKNTAMNVRTFIQTIFGGLKFASEKMVALGFDETTGWSEARVIAKTALDVTGKTWQGYNVKSQADREKAQLLRKNKAETQAQLEATKDTPRALNESYASWQARIALVAEKMVDEARTKAQVSEVEMALQKLVEKHDIEVLALLSAALAEHVRAQMASDAEIDQATADALMAQYTEPVETVEAE